MSISQFPLTQQNWKQLNILIIHSGDNTATVVPSFA